ncbi:conjugal transfer protein TraF [Clostridium sp. AL.422]|uniref:conjugal transfer protein TraF n=1 Tax=Clostridium TaxID=1485 RepID=UPI00293DF727|nr:MULTISPECIES: conjugal transfer protein TraF [unclassified Clostridium]MDV4152038.1 conjugal transfer protein TraF [Clostridium sp. AL.422]
MKSTKNDKKVTVNKFKNKKSTSAEKKITNKDIIKFFIKFTVGMFLVALVVGAVVTLFDLKIYKNIDDVKHVKFNNILKESDEKYLLYLYERNNEICDFIEPTILEYSKKTTIPIYAVDMSEDENKDTYEDVEFYTEDKEKLSIDLSPAMILVESGNIVDYGENVEDVMGLIGRFYMN